MIIRRIDWWWDYYLYLAISIYIVIFHPIILKLLIFILKSLINCFTREFHQFQNSYIIAVHPPQRLLLEQFACQSPSNYQHANLMVHQMAYKGSYSIIHLILNYLHLRNVPNNITDNDLGLCWILCAVICLEFIDQAYLWDTRMNNWHSWFNPNFMMRCQCKISQKLMTP